MIFVTLLFTVLHPARRPYVRQRFNGNPNVSAKAIAVASGFITLEIKATKWSRR